MTNKKNKFFTFCCSMIPGAGEMYLGFYKQGISLMTSFFALCVIGGTLNLPSMIFLTPVIWFYSFFHVHNLNGLPDDEFYASEDDWLFHPGTDGKNLDYWFLKYRKLLAGLMIFFGFSLLWEIISDFVFRIFNVYHFSEEAWMILRSITNAVPQGVIAIVIILFGIHLIRQKKQLLDKEPDSIIPAPPYLIDKES